MEFSPLEVDGLHNGMRRFQWVKVERLDCEVGEKVSRKFNFEGEPVALSGRTEYGGEGGLEKRAVEKDAE